ncbi:MAG: RimK family alpha-L-glutamate ligase, partial [Planctomycetes bacterium]|nr:RimK family alpha-L-glutamate ligase [Planctomycetota bacterium]
LINVTNSGVILILQEFISDSTGRDLRVITIGGRAIACMKRTAPEGSFKANFSGGGTTSAYKMTPEIEWLATEASRIFDLDVAGVDLLFDGDHFKICEVNSSPGFEGMESCHKGISIAQSIYDYIRVRIGKF